MHSTILKVLCTACTCVRLLCGCKDQILLSGLNTLYTDCGDVLSYWCHMMAPAGTVLGIEYTAAQCEVLFICIFTHLFIYSFIYLLIYSFTHLLIYSFTHLLFIYYLFTFLFLFTSSPQHDVRSLTCCIPWPSMPYIQYSTA